MIASRIDADAGGVHVDLVVLGPFRSERRAHNRANTVARLAAKYDDPAATLHVIVEPIRSGSTSAQEAMDRLYGSIA
jgi:hypothetical protein